MALNQLARLEAELAALRADVADAKARVEEWNEAPDVGAQLARYASINEAMGEQLAADDGVAEMNAVLKRLLGGAYMIRNAAGISVYFELASDNDLCDWVRADALGTTGAQTFLKVPLWSAVPIPPRPRQLIHPCDGAPTQGGRFECCRPQHNGVTAASRFGTTGFGVAA